MIRNRIKEHRRVRAGDLVPHEHNWRTHPDSQRQALLDLYHEVGFARSLLAFELADGRLQLIDGHLRRDLDPEMIVEVEVLDVTADEANKLLLSLDPLVGLAGTDSEAVAELLRVSATESQALNELWESLAGSEQRTQAELPEPPPPPPEQFLILIECADESEQRRLLERFQAEGLTCRALLS